MVTILSPIFIVLLKAHLKMMQNPETKFIYHAHYLRYGQKLLPAVKIEKKIVTDFLLLFAISASDANFFFLFFFFLL